MLQVCDHRKECRCEPGWLPPDCETPTESEGSSKGVTIAIVVVCVLIGILLIGLAIFFYKRRKNTFSNPRQQKVHVVDIPDYSHQSIPNQRPSPGIKPTAPPPPPPSSVKPRALNNDFLNARQALRPPPPRV